MKKAVFLIAILFMASNLLAHSPKKVELKYSKTTKELTVNTLHKVKDVKKHYISHLIIHVNGEEIKKLEYTEQTNKKDHTVNIPVEVKAGDTIDVTAKCSKLGKKKGTLKISE